MCSHETEAVGFLGRCLCLCFRKKNNDLTIQIQTTHYTGPGRWNVTATSQPFPNLVVSAGKGEAQMTTVHGNMT